jgi:glycosyltransferase involved in cell wall biosynthesis
MTRQHCFMYVVCALVTLLVATLPTLHFHTADTPPLTSSSSNTDPPVDEERADELQVAGGFDDSVVVWWCAPFFSGGGYSSEAIATVLPLSTRVHVHISQHADLVSEAFLDGLSPAIQSALHALGKTLHALLPRLLPVRRRAGGKKEINEETTDPLLLVVVCHSEAGAIGHPPLYDTTWCPPVLEFSPLAHLTDVPSHPRYHRVARTMFESDRLPDGWAVRLRASVDEVWVPTAFHREIFIAGGLDPDRVFVIHEPVDVHFFDPARSCLRSASAPFSLYSLERHSFSAARSAHTGSPHVGPPRAPHTGPPRAPRIATAPSPALTGWSATLAGWFPAGSASSPARHPTGGSPPTRFLSIFKWEWRKGHTLLLDAFFAEFRDAPERAELFLLTSRFHNQGSSFAEEVRARALTAAEHSDSLAARLLARVHLVDEHVPDELLPCVYAAADAFVLPTRGEGWCRPCVEAMASALPIIVTAWSGPTEFLTVRNSYPLPLHPRTPFVRPPGGAFRDHLFANPSLLALRAHLRAVVDHPAEAARRGAQARRDVVRRFSPEVIAQQIVDRLNAIQRGKQAQESEIGTESE